MKIKGHAKIELIDAETGEVKRTVEQDNTVTGFASELFKNRGTLGWNQCSEFQNARPIDDLFGGILLFDEQINSASIYCPAGVKMIGNATIDTLPSNPGTLQLGSYDAEASETSDKTNDTKRTYVYEWSETQGNGTIKTISLTSRAGGYIGTGQRNSTDDGYIWDESLTRYMNHYSTKISTTRSRTMSFSDFEKLATIELDTGTAICLKDSPAVSLSSGKVTLEFYNIPVSKIQPFISKSNFSTEKAFKNSEDITINFHDEDNTFPSTAPSIYAARIVSGLGYILLVGVESGVGSWINQGANVHVIKLFKNNGSWTAKYYKYLNLQPMTGSSITRISLYTSSRDTTSSDYPCCLFGKILDDDCIPTNSASYGALFISNSTGQYNDGWGDYNTGNIIERSLIIYSDGTVRNITIPYYYTHPTSSNQKIIGSAYHQGVLNGRIKLGQCLYWDPIFNKLYMTNATVFNSTSIANTQNIPCFDSYTFFNSSNFAPQDYGNITKYYSSPLSVHSMDCNWLATIADLGTEGITKTNMDTLRITYTLEFDPTA